MYSLATYEPYYGIIHGNEDNGKLLVIFEYELDEFYNNEWKGEINFYKKQNLIKTRSKVHPLLRNYHKIMKKSKIELVEINEINNIQYCVLHTYKINILKRLWKKKFYGL